MTNWRIDSEEWVKWGRLSTALCSFMQRPLTAFVWPWYRAIVPHGLSSIGLHRMIDEQIRSQHLAFFVLLHLRMGAIAQTCVHHGASSLQRFRPRAAGLYRSKKRRQGRLVYFSRGRFLQSHGPRLRDQVPGTEIRSLSRRR